MWIPGGILEIYLTGGSDGASFFEPKKYSSLKFTPKKIRIEILYPKKYLASKFYTQKIQDIYTYM